MIKTFDYLETFYEIKDEVMAAVSKVLESGQLILGSETSSFESEFAKFVGSKHCIAVNSGTTALQLALMALGVGYGDEVITVSNTCVPTVAAIELCGAIPVFVDISDEDLMIDWKLIDKALTNKTKCFVPVHLWGQSADLDEIERIAENENIFIAEDCAQAAGTKFKGRHVGTFGQCGCFSFYPTKNLGAYGDAGAIVTNDDELSDRLRSMRVYGYDKNQCSLIKGINGRVSEIQAAILRIKLRYLSEWLKRRKEIAAIYNESIRNTHIKLPYMYEEREHSFHQYVIRCKSRDKFTDALMKNSISYGIHYAAPVHSMPEYKRLQRHFLSLPITERSCKEILSIPIHEALSDEEAGQVAEVLSSA